MSKIRQIDNPVPFTTLGACIGYIKKFPKKMDYVIIYDTFGKIYYAGGKELRAIGRHEVRWQSGKVEQLG